MQKIRRTKNWRGASDCSARCYYVFKINLNVSLYDIKTILIYHQIFHRLITNQALYDIPNNLNIRLPTYEAYFLALKVHHWLTFQLRKKAYQDFYPFLKPALSFSKRFVYFTVYFITQVPPLNLQYLNSLLHSGREQSFCLR